MQWQETYFFHWQRSIREHSSMVLIRVCARLWFVEKTNLKHFSCVQDDKGLMMSFKYVNGFQLASSESQFEKDRIKFKLKETKISLLQGVWQTKFKLPDSKKFSLVLRLHCDYSLPKQKDQGVPLAPTERYQFGTQAIIKGSRLINLNGTFCEYDGFTARMRTTSCLKKVNTIHT